MDKLIEHYNKFNEDKRLLSRHGQVEFIVSMKYIHEYLNILQKESLDRPLRILDVGAATGAYSIPLAAEGYEVHALELVKHNVQRLRAKADSYKQELNLHALQGNALKLSKKYERDYFDLVLIFGPMYHLFSFEDKMTVIEEVKKVTKTGGIIMIAYLMNDYAVVKHGFIENSIADSFANNKIDSSYNVTGCEEDLYDYVSLDTINKLYKNSELERLNIFTPDGPANYIRPALRDMDEQSFELFVKYVESISQRPDMLGAAGHTVDVLKKL